MIEEIEKLILADPRTFFPGAGGPRGLGVLLVKGSLGAHAGRVTFLVFRDKAAEPSLAVKIARDPAGESLLASEACALRFQAERMSPAVSRAAPKLLYEGSCGGAAFIAEEAVPGTALGSEMAESLFFHGRKTAARLAEMADWLGRLARESGHGGGEKRAATTAELFRARYPLTDAETKFLDGLKGSLEGLDRECPKVFVHGDFSPMNVYFGGEGMRVIDWAESSRDGTPLHDIFFMLTCFAFDPGRAEEEGVNRLDNFSSLFFREGKRSELAFSTIKRYLDSMRIDEGMLRPLLVLFLMERANLEFEVLERQGQRGYLIPMKPFGSDAKWADGGLQRCGLYARLFRRLAGDHCRLIF